MIRSPQASIIIRSPMQAQHAKIAKLRLALKEHQQPTLRREPSMVEGACNDSIF